MDLVERMFKEGRPLVGIEKSTAEEKIRGARTTLWQHPALPGTVMKLVRHRSTRSLADCLYEADITQACSAAGGPHLVKETHPAVHFRTAEERICTALFLERGDTDLFDYGFTLYSESAARSGQRPPGLPEAELWRVARHLIEGLLSLKRAGIVHRDVKPENVIVFLSDSDRDASAGASEGPARKAPLPTFRLADYGAAFRVRPAIPATARFQRPTEYGAGFVTSAYMSPEAHALHHHTVGDYDLFAADVYSVGLLLARLAGNELLFMQACSTCCEHYRNGFSTAALREEAFRVRAPDLSSAARALVLRCLVSEAEGRPTLEELAEDPWLRGTPGPGAAAEAEAEAVAVKTEAPRCDKTATALTLDLFLSE